MPSSCKNCGSTKLDSLYNAPDFDSGIHGTRRYFGLARCSFCQIVNTTGDKFNEVAEAYSTGYYGSANYKFLAIIERAIHLSNVIRARKILGAWRAGCQNKKTPSVLDIGCGRGHLLQAFKTQGASVLGLERQEFPIEKGDSDFVHIGSIGDREYAESKFDIIILWHVLEHMEEHDTLLNSIAEHLNDEGLLIVAVPNFSSFQQWLFSKYWFHLDLPRHLVHFELNWLKQRLTSRGFILEASSFIDPLQNIFGFVQSTMNFMAPKKLNNYYNLLKHSYYRREKSTLKMVAWSLLAFVLLPFAILESLFGSIFQRGATVQFTARLTNER